MSAWSLTLALALALAKILKRAQSFTHRRRDWWLRFFFIVLMGGLATNAYSATPVPSQETPSQDHSLILQITHHQHQQWLSLADIETLPLYDVELKHPEGLEGRFTGVWLNVFTAQQGIPEDTRIRLIAHDNYTIFLSHAERKERRYFMVTRFNGLPIERQQMGPLLLIVPADAEGVLEGTLPLTRWIWAIREIRYQ
ncbi:hypothetical protein QC823_11645 [Halomonas vilamensis]|uniref:Oxidoreductase molybdopterin-binding domain-containing protein n=1 Tax=Vreelandella vilamensis TaxID=531309 RepID=A0ABU1H7I1_9GAMM|nr:hypothetical protein [Halomonas vilamensis]MDR5899637.1 hypothetical protein [Halomonas vilamensis]